MGRRLIRRGHVKWEPNEEPTEITMRGEQTRLERLLGRIETSLRGGWKRDPAEERLGRHGVRGPWDCCFSCTAAADRPAAGLWVHARSPDELTSPA